MPKAHDLRHLTAQRSQLVLQACVHRASFILSPISIHVLVVSCVRRRRHHLFNFSRQNKHESWHAFWSFAKRRFEKVGSNLDSKVKGKALRKSADWGIWDVDAGWYVSGCMFEWGKDNDSLTTRKGCGCDRKVSKSRLGSVIKSSFNYQSEARRHRAEQ